jgi:hypothetical protein
MASTKIKDLVVKVGSYTDRNSGQEKSEWEPVGAIMQNDDGSMFVMLKRTFNPAGVSGQDGRKSLLISAFDPQPRDGQQREPRRDDTPRDGGNGGGYGGAPAGSGPRPDMDDEIPF